MPTDLPAPLEAADLDSEPQLVFHGSPSPAVNLPALVMALMIIGGVWWSRLALGAPTYLMAAVVLVAVAYLGVQCLRTARTVYTVDTERIHVRTRVFGRDVTSLELFKVRDVRSTQSWWQARLGIGTVRVDSSDTDTPLVFLRGMENSEALQDALSKASVQRRRELGIHEVNFTGA